MQHSKTGKRCGHSFAQDPEKKRESKSNFCLAKSNYGLSLFKGSFHQQPVGFHEGRMFEVTAVLCKMNIFHRGCLSVGNARHGYTSRVRDFSSRANWWKKLSGLVLTEIDMNLWALFGQEQSMVRTLCKERLRWSKEMADNGQRRHILRDAGSAWAELIHTIAMAGRAACWGQPGGSHHTAACQERRNSHIHTPFDRQRIQSSGYVMMQHKFLQWKLKAALLRQQPERTFDTVAADVSVCFLINTAD